MNETPDDTPRPTAESGFPDRPGQDPIGRGLMAASRVLAIGGGLIFTALVAMSIVSIVGRKIAAAPVPGDVEMLQMGAAVGASTFFAHCHMVRRNIRVDFFTAWLPAAWSEGLDAAGSLLLAVVGALVAARTWAGAATLREFGETSAVLAIPVWIAQILMVPGFMLMAAAGLYMAVWHGRRIVAGVPGRR